MMVRATWSSSAIAVLSVALLAVGCGRDEVTPPQAPTVTGVLYGKVPAGLSVASASPAFGDQGVTLDVHVLGSGFTTGAQATWLLHGLADPAHVRTNSTTYVSSTELVANITIASDATLDFWDVQVALAGGKNGVGSEAFEVTAAQILGSGTIGGSATVVQMNDLLQVVGFSTSSGNAETAWVYDPTSGMLALGPGEANGIDPLGAFAVGIDPRSVPTAWIKQSGNIWATQALPQPAGSLGAGAYGVTRRADGTALVVGWNVTSTGKKSGLVPAQAVAWQRDANNVWSNPQVYPSPPGFTQVEARDVTPQGVVVGHLDWDKGIVWENPTTYTVLDAKPARINPAGTLIVGQVAGGVAVFWWRDPVTGRWHLPATPLPSLAGSSCPDGFGLDVNDYGVIVGWSCAGSTSNPTVWQVDLSSGSPVLVGAPKRLPGLGIMTTDDLNAARAVTNSPPFVVAGAAYISKTGRVAVQWNLR
jgi:hypothetical protein